MYFIISHRIRLSMALISVTDKRQTGKYNAHMLADQQDTEKVLHTQYLHLKSLLHIAYTNTPHTLFTSELIITYHIHKYSTHNIYIWNYYYISHTQILHTQYLHLTLSSLHIAYSSLLVKVVHSQLKRQTHAIQVHQKSLKKKKKVFLHKTIITSNLAQSHSTYRPKELEEKKQQKNQTSSFKNNINI
jgi:hypothetical protein